VGTDPDLLTTPTLTRATPAALLTDDAAPLSRAAYALTYALSGPPGAFALQRVETRVRWLRAARVLVAYDAVYWEFFRFGDDAAEARSDVHDFDQQRDGWGPGPLARLLRRRGVVAPGDPARLEVTKTFLLGHGSVDDPLVKHTTRGGGSFGFLAEVDGEAARAALSVGDPAQADEVAAPLPGPRGGRGRLLGPAWRAQERLTFDPLTLDGRLERTPYVEVPTG
jgi:hypothetical protein